MAIQEPADPQQGLQRLPMVALAEQYGRMVRGHRAEQLRTFLSQRSAQVGLVLLSVLVLAAIFAPFITPYGPSDILNGPGEPGRRAESCIHLLGCPAETPETYLGTDGNSFDIWTRTIYGARISLWIGFVTAGLAIVVGATIGAIAAYAGGWTDNVLMRIMDVLLAFPALLLAIAIVSIMDKSLINAQIAVAIVAIPIYARVMRASVISVKEQDFVTASRALGESSGGILGRRILPNALTPLVVTGTLGIASAVLEVAALSFLGLGANPFEPEWGNMIGREFNGIFTRPLITLAPGIALTITVLAFNLLGDALRDTLDPRLNR